MNQKLKSENYQNFGGINVKISKYDNTALEFLDIVNFDAQTPGALSQRWGSTQYISQSFSGQINSLFEFSRLNGESYVLASVSGGIWYGATTGTYQGISLVVPGSSYGIGVTFVGTGDSPTALLTGAAGGISVYSVNQLYQGSAQQYYGSGNINSVAAQSQSDNILSSAVLNNWLFQADGNKFYKFDGASTYPVGSINPILFNAPTAFFGPTFCGVTVNNAAASSTVGIAAGTTARSFGFWASYVNNRGFESQKWPVAYIDATQSSAATLGGSFIQAWFSIRTPQYVGISSINIYSFAQSATFTYPILNSVGVTSLATVGSTFWDPPYVLLGNYPASGSTNVTIVPLGTSLGNQANMYSNVGTLDTSSFNSYYPLGLTLISGATFWPGNQIVGFQYPNYFPRYLETYQNRLFLAGFSLTPSTVWFSDLAEPEGYPLENNFEVRTNDADVITCMKAYSTRLYIFKKNSFHTLLGDNPNNFFLQEVSLVYGCLNNRCAVVYDDLLAFLDQKGVMLYNGANLQCLSNKVQPYFDRMNYAVALNTAIMVHDKLRNQIMIAIPIDGSSVNNITMVYDYLNGSWSTYKGYTPTAFATIQGYNNTKNAFYGSYSGTINWFGPSFLADNGVGFTCSFKTRFLHDMGESIEKQFRRLYLNIDNFGVTLTFPINFYQDYGSSVVLSSTMFIDGFQNRLEYGIPAKSLAFEMSSYQASFPVKIYGFTIESRLQRRV